VSSRLPVINGGRMEVLPVTVLDRKLMKKRNRVATAGLIQWVQLRAFLSFKRGALLQPSGEEQKLSWKYT
jgi:hypothetical protein